MHYYRYTHSQIFITVHFYSAGNLLPSNGWIKEVAVQIVPMPVMDIKPYMYIGTYLVSCYAL